MVLSESGEDIRRHERQQKSAVLANRAREVRVESKNQRRRHAARHEAAASVGQHGLRKRRPSYGDDRDEGDRNDAHQQDEAEKLRGEKLSRLLCIRFQNVAHHVGVDRRPEFLDEVGGGRREKDENGRNGFQHVGQRSGRKHRIERGDQDRRRGRNENPIRHADRLNHAEKASPERGIESGDDVQGDQQTKLAGRDRDATGHGDTAC